MEELLSTKRQEQADLSEKIEMISGERNRLRKHHIAAVSKIRKEKSMHLDLLKKLKKDKNDSEAQAFEESVLALEDKEKTIGQDWFCKDNKLYHAVVEASRKRHTVDSFLDESPRGKYLAQLELEISKFNGQKGELTEECKFRNIYWIFRYTITPTDPSYQEEIHRDLAKLQVIHKQYMDKKYYFVGTIENHNEPVGKNISEYVNNLKWERNNMLVCGSAPKYTCISDRFGGRGFKSNNLKTDI